MSMTGGKSYCVLDRTSSKGNRVRLYIYVKEKRQSVSSNTTILQLGMYVNSEYNIGAWTDSNGSYIGTATSGSNCYTFNGSISKGSGTRWLIENKEVVVKHNTDGDKSIYIYWKWGVNAYESYIDGYQNPSGNKKVTLTTIPQASTIKSADNITLNGTDQIYDINVERKSSKFYHKVKITCGTKSITSNAFTTSVRVTIPNTWLSEFPNSTYKNATVTLTTYNSSACTTKVGSPVSKTIKIIAGGSIKPSATGLTATIVNGIKNDTKTYCIKGKSSVKLTVNGAKAGTGAKISGYIFSGPNISGSSSTYTGTSSSKTSSVIKSSDTKTYSVQVKDTRGRLSSKVTVKISVIDYTLPNITSLKVERSDDDKSATVTVKITYDNNTGTDIPNYPVLTLTKGSTTSLLTSPQSTKTTYTKTYTKLASSDTAIIKATLYDTICGSKNAITKSVKLQSAERILNIARYGNGIAIGGLSSVRDSSASSKFECNWDMYASKSIGFTHLWNSSNSPNIFCQWRDGENHDMISRYNDGLKMGIGWSGEHTTTNADGTTTTKQYDTILDLRSPTTSARGELLTNAKTGAYDGKQGVCVSNNGRVYVVGDANAAQKTPGIVFAYNKSKEGTSSIFETAKGELTLDANTITTGNISTGGKLGSTSAYNAVFSMYCKWKDGDDHNLIDRDKDGLTAGIGWGGVHKNSNNTTTTYKTVLNLRGQTVKVTYGSGAGTISDERLKNSFIDLNQYEKFFNNLHPIAYKYNNGNSGRYHIGFGAQSVERALLESGLDNTCFGGILHYPIDNKSEDYNGYDEEYGLIYNEFIALNTHMIQKLKSENEELKNKVSLLEEKLDSVITEIENLKESIKNEA